MKTGKFILCLTVVSLIGTILVFPTLPQMVPIHWGMNGSVDNAADKWILFLTALFPAIIYAFRLFISKIDPKRESYEKHKKAFQVSILAVALLLTAIHWVAIFYSLGYIVDISLIVKLLLGIMMIVIGNFMGQIRHNYLFGIKNPWTYANEQVWKKVHHTGGYVMIAAGIIVCTTAFLERYIGTVILLITLLLVIAFNNTYSYMQYKKLVFGKKSR